VVTAIGLTAARDGWVFAPVDSEVRAWAAAWALGHLDIPSASVSYGAPVLLWPFGIAFGESVSGALPLLVVLQVAVGGPVVLLAVYGIASRIGGRLLGYAAALAWVVAPLLALGFFYADQRTFQGIPYDDFRGLVHDTLLPGALGLTVGPGYPSLVAIVVAAWLVVRSLDRGAWNDVLLAGLLAGFAVGLRPLNALFLAAPLLALAVARRPRHALGLAAALLPAAGTLALWRWAGQGHLGLEGLAFTREEFWVNRVHFRGAGWSYLLVAWIAVAGSFAVVRKAPAKGLLVAAWFTGFFVLGSGSLARGRVIDGSLFRLLEPGYPAFVLLSAALLLLVPPWGRRVRATIPPEQGPRATPGLVAAAVALALYPFAIVALAAVV
jgi:hypothetical protein